LDVAPSLASVRDERKKRKKGKMRKLREKKGMHCHHQVLQKLRAFGERGIV
jgi:hypothetical protein